MIERVHLRLCVWADAVRGGCGGSVGNVWTFLLGAGVVSGEFGSSELIDSAVEEVESAVALLPTELREVIKVFYFEGDMIAERHAKKLGISRATLFRRRDIAHEKLDEMLHGKIKLRTASGL